MDTMTGYAHGNVWLRTVGGGVFMFFAGGQHRSQADR